jgi:Carboxypeptidase regulatory-like domain
MFVPARLYRFYLTKKKSDYMRHRFSILLWAFTVVLLITSCKKDEPTEDPINNIASNSTRLFGTVRDASGAPVAGAQVMFGSSITTTTNSGYYTFNNVVSGDRCFVSCTKNGFFNGSQGVISQLGGSTQADIMLLANTTDFTVSSGSDQNLFLTDGAGFILPANSLNNADGTGYSGTVNVAIEHLDG